MPPLAPEQLSRTIETLYRSESGRILATLVRLLGDLDLAEEVMHEAFAAALETWPQAGVPDKPRPWLISRHDLRPLTVCAGARASTGHREILLPTWNRASTTLRLGMKRSRTIASV